MRFLLEHLLERFHHLCKGPRTIAGATVTRRVKCLGVCGSGFYTCAMMLGLLPGRVAFLCKGTRANVRGASLLVQRCLNNCWSNIYKVRFLLEHLREQFHHLCKGACTFAEVAYTK